MNPSVIALEEEQVLPTRNHTALAHIKRFTERYRGDAGFRALLNGDSILPETLQRYGLHISPENALAYLAADRGEQLSLTQDLKDYCNFLNDTAKTDSVATLANESSNAKYMGWRQRQLGALRFHFSSLSDSVVRPVVAYELSRGCSVGCWFCAVGAEKLQSHFTASIENMQFFRSVQVAMRETLGEAAGAGMCYWATDAFDNPDYERFATCFAEVHGAFPPTTTALAWKDPQRTRELLQTAAAHGTLLNRFSVLSLGMLNRIHAAFSPEELLTTDLVFQMPDALVSIGPTRTLPAKKIRAGRARSLSADDSRVYEDEAGTVACVIGFLLNFVDRSLRLITPCIPSEANPLGYRILDTVTGIDGCNIGTNLSILMERHMPIHAGNSLLRPGGTLDIEVQSGFITVQSRAHTVRVPGYGLPDDILETFADLLRLGTHTSSQILATMRTAGMNLLQAQSLLERLRAEGVFELHD